MGEAVASYRAGAPATAPFRADPESHAAARRALRGQIARLDAEIGAAVVRSFAMRGHGEGSRPGPAGHGGAARVLDIGELERVRDDLVERLHAVRTANDARAQRQASKRAELERMLLHPGHHRFTRISCEELGEPGCGVWEVRPRLGLIGMLAGWWQVKLSSGCPLAGLRETRRRALVRR